MRARRLGVGVVHVVILAIAPALPGAALAQSRPGTAQAGTAQAGTAQAAVRAAPNPQASASSSPAAPIRATPRRPASSGGTGRGSSGSSTVYLRNGTQAHGTLLRSEPGDYVLLLQADGVRTIPWYEVDHVEAPASNVPGEGAGASTQSAPAADAGRLCCADAGRASAADATLDQWADVSFGWDARLEGISLFKHYTIGDRSTWFNGQGAGGGVSASLHFRGPAALGFSSVRWVELELGVGNSTHYVSWKEGVRFRTNFVENETSVIVGAHLARGRWAGDGGGVPWSGVVFGLAWVPTYVYFFENAELDSAGKLNPAGLRLTIDWGRVSPEKSGLLPGVRASFTWLPYLGSLPSVLNLGLGCVFY
jgi:hypothetical protein